jgi:hypothetical protein
MSWLYQELPFHQQAILKDCREIKGDDIVGLLREVQALYTHEVEVVSSAERSSEDKILIMNVRFKPTPRSDWNEYSVTDGRVIGVITME